jgi:Precorrin-6x reductase CbiJ/CobK
VASVVKSRQIRSGRLRAARSDVVPDPLPYSPAGPLSAARQIIVTCGPYTAEADQALMKQHHIDVLVTKNSDATATTGKLTPARDFAIPVIVISRPPSGPACSSSAAAENWRAQAKAVKDALTPRHARHDYYNFAETPDDAHPLLPPASYHRLQQIKATYDPDQGIISAHPVYSGW